MVTGERTGHCRDGPALSRGALPNQDTDGGWLGTGGGCRVQLRGGFSQGGLRPAAVPGEESAVCGQVCVCVCLYYINVLLMETYFRTAAHFWVCFRRLFALCNHI